MRDPEILIGLLERMAAEGHGRIPMVLTGGSNHAEYHHAELLSDVGHAEWLSDSVIRITAQGYDFLSASKQPGMREKFAGWMEKGVRYADAANKIMDLLASRVA